MAIDVQTKRFHDADGRVEYSSTRLFTFTASTKVSLSGLPTYPLTQGS